MLREYQPRPRELRRSLRRPIKAFRRSQRRIKPAMARMALRIRKPPRLRIIRTSHLCLMIQATPNRLRRLSFHPKSPSIFSSPLLKEWRLPLFRSPRFNLRYRIQYRWHNQKKSRPKVAPQEVAP